jgi:hypothetical protein
MQLPLVLAAIGNFACRSAQDHCHQSSQFFGERLRVQPIYDLRQLDPGLSGKPRDFPSRMQFEFWKSIIPKRLTPLQQLLNIWACAVQLCAADKNR